MPACRATGCVFWIDPARTEVSGTIWTAGVYYHMTTCFQALETTDTTRCISSHCNKFELSLINLRPTMIFLYFEFMCELTNNLTELSLINTLTTEDF